MYLNFETQHNIKNYETLLSTSGSKETLTTTSIKESTAVLVTRLANFYLRDIPLKSIIHQEHNVNDA